MSEMRDANFYPAVTGAYVTDKPNYGRGGTVGKANSTTPGQRHTPGLSGAQSSGKVIHHRVGGMNTAGKGENLNGMPTVHTGGGKGSIAGVA